MSIFLKRKIMNDQYKLSRLMYIIEAAIEYFVSIAVSTVYLARITAYIGMSDALSGILSAFVSLGCAFQIFAIFLTHKTPVKKWVTVGHIISQLLFACIYFVPLLNISQTGKIVIFILILLVAYIIHNVINSPKINWFMSLVDDGKRGVFTANKEMVSLLGGVVFSYALGAVMDHFDEIGDTRTAFVVWGLGIVVLMVLHSVTLLLSKEKTVEIKKDANTKTNLKELFRNKTLFKIILISVLWNIANYATISFTGTYQDKELAFSMTFSSIIIMVGSIIRALFSRPIGKLADKSSFCNMLIICFSIEAVAFGINIFTAPSNGKWMYFIYYILHCIGMAGINSATINLIYDYVDHDKRTSALAIQQTLAGLSGFFAVLLLSPIVELIQKNGLDLFGKPVYAQQIMSLLSCVFVIGIIVYLVTVIKKLKKMN